MNDRLREKLEGPAAVREVIEALRNLLAAAEDVVDADRVDARMGFPLPGDSALAAAIGLSRMQRIEQTSDALARLDAVRTGRDGGRQ